MLIVETIGKIRLAYFSRKMTIKAICRDLRVSRKVVRKVIRSQATEFHYERDVQPQPKIGPWRDRLDSLLLENDGKPARERLTLIRVFEELRGLGYEGGYDAVRRYARAWSKERASETASAYVPLSIACVRLGKGPVRKSQDRRRRHCHVAMRKARAGYAPRIFKPPRRPRATWSSPRRVARGEIELT